MKTVSDPINTRQETGWRRSLEAKVIVYNLTEIRCCVQKNWERNYIQSVLFFSSSSFCHTEGDAATKVQLKTIENNGIIPMEWNKMSFLCVLLCKGHQKGLTAEQKSRLQKHTLTCKHKSPSLSLDLRFPPSTIRSATEPFPANFPHE